MPREYDIRPRRKVVDGRATDLPTSEINGESTRDINDTTGRNFGETITDAEGVESDSENLDLRGGQHRQELGRTPRGAPSSVNETMARYKKAQARKFSEQAHVQATGAPELAESPRQQEKPGLTDTTEMPGTPDTRGAQSKYFSDAKDSPTSPASSAVHKNNRKPPIDSKSFSDKQSAVAMPNPVSRDSAVASQAVVSPADNDALDNLADTVNTEQNPKSSDSPLSHERNSALTQDKSGRLKYNRALPGSAVLPKRRQTYRGETAYAPVKDSGGNSPPANVPTVDVKYEQQNNSADLPRFDGTAADSAAVDGERSVGEEHRAIKPPTSDRIDYSGKTDADPEPKIREKSSKLRFDDESGALNEDGGTLSKNNKMSDKSRSATGRDDGISGEGAVADTSGNSAVADTLNKKGGKASGSHDGSTGNSTANKSGDSTGTPGDSSAKSPDVSPDQLKSAKLLEKAQHKAEQSADKLSKAQGKLPKKRVLRTDKEFDPEKGKMKPRLRFEEEVKTQREHLRGSAVTRPVKTGANIAVGYAHKKVFQHEDENVGVKAAHKGEMMGESGLRYAYRRHKTAPYRRVEKLQKRTTKLNARASYRKTLHDNPELRKKSLSKMMQKRRIKKQYAKAARKAMVSGKKTALTTKFVMAAKTKIVAVAAKVAVKVKAVLLNPKVLLVLGIAALIMILILGLVSACSGMASSVGQSFAAMSYLAEDEDIDDATILYSELEADLRYRILNIEDEYPDFDEYRLDIGMIGHDPHMLIAFLTAVYQEFTFADVEATIRAMFDEQHNLVIEPEVEIRTRMEEREGSSTDPETGETVYYTYEAEVEYEWHILNVTLDSQSFIDIITARMDAEQGQHYALLMQSRGLRQIVQSPFTFNWLPFASSHYGWRISPISVERELHLGVDIALPTGTPILAATDGTVTFAGDMGGFGLVVFIDDGDGIVTVYAHCDTLLVATGQTITAGDTIATVGSTGSSTGPHLHFEVIRNGRHLNPAIFALSGGF